MTTIWVSGQEIIDNGTDELSRALTVDTHDYSLNIPPQELLRDHFPHLPDFDIDWFASPRHTQAQRFWTRTWCPNAEGCDAFTAPTWAEITCCCGKSHTPLAFFFPPPPLLNTFWNHLGQETIH